MTSLEVVDCEACGKEGEADNLDEELGWCCNECKNNIESDRFAEEEDDIPDSEQVFRDELQMRELEDEYAAGTL